jgi:ferrous iron transport protein B
VTDTTTFGVSLDQVLIRRKARTSIAVIGNPNSGKSTLFNRLTGLRQSTGNYPGVTVEKHTGIAQLQGCAVELIDLPGIYCLSGHSVDERIAVDVVLGRVVNTAKPSGLLVVVDATHLYQGLYLLEQLLELSMPTIVAITMADVAHANGISIDLAGLSKKLGGVPICEVVASTGKGLDQLKIALEDLPRQPPRGLPESWPELSATAQKFSDKSGGSIARIDIIQALLHPESPVDEKLLGLFSGDGRIEGIEYTREQLFGDQPPQAAEARHRYRWARKTLEEVQHSTPIVIRFSARLRHWLNRPWPATLMFFAVMVLIFQAVFSWATPIMEKIDFLAASAGSALTTLLGEGAFSSFVADGVIAGVGSVVVFLPQILILFLFIIVLEDSGYLARAAFLMDRLMRSVGLSGQSVIPLLSSFACAVPAIMATRVIPDRRDRIATILAAPFMTCSARLPIYALLIAAFVPQRNLGLFNVQGLVLFGLYLLGIAGGLLTARLLKSSALRGPQPVFMLALPEFRWPNLQTVLIKLMDRVRVFLKRAGTVIFSVAVIVWFLAYYPRAETNLASELGQDSVQVAARQDSASLNEAAAAQMEQSWLGRMGRQVEPLFQPLGWDWRVSSAVIAGFPAREVVVAVMGTLYAVGSEADNVSLTQKLKSARWPDGKSIFTMPMVLGLMVFYAWCLQCAATLAVIRRETNTWRWPVIAWGYMTGLGYLGALVIYQAGTLIWH